MVHSWELLRTFDNGGHGKALIKVQRSLNGEWWRLHN
jgi:hypothetical protein